MNSKKTQSFKRTQALALPTISLAELKKGVSRYFKSLSDDIVIKETVDDDGKPKVENGKPVMIRILHVVDLETGEEGEIVLGVVVYEAIKDKLKKGFKFEIIKGGKVNRTFRWEVYEIE